LLTLKIYVMLVAFLYVFESEWIILGDFFKMRELNSELFILYDFIERNRLLFIWIKEILFIVQHYDYFM